MSPERLEAAKTRTRRRRVIGVPPGTVSVDPSAPRPSLSVMAYGAERFQEQALTDLSLLADLMSRFPVTWVNIDGLGDAELLRRLADIFKIHPLSLEDVVNVHQRAKIDAYPHYQFIVARMANPGRTVEMEQLSLFLGRNFLLSFQEREGDCFGPVRDRLRKNLGPIRRMGPDYLAYCLLDGVIDCYFPILENYGERLDVLEETTLARGASHELHEIHSIKRDLIAFRRAAWPLRETVNGLQRAPSTLWSEETRLHLRDLYDHTIQIIDLLETYRERCSDLLDVYLSSMGNRMNEVMRLLTIIATIFIPMTFIASIYGMNFKHMPELEWRWGYLWAIGVMAAVAIALLMFFYRKGWLKSFSPDGK